MNWQVNILTIKGRTAYCFFDNSINIPPTISVFRARPLHNKLTMLLYYYKLIPFFNLFCLSSYFLGIKILKSNPVDIIVATTPQVSELISGYWLAKKFKIPLIIDFRDPYYPPFLYKKLFKRILSFAQGIVTTSDSYQNILQAQSKRDDIAIIPNGVDLEIIKKHIRPKNNKFTIVYSGVLIDLYRIMDLLKVMKELSREINIQAVVIGETKGFEYLIDYAQSNHLAVKFTGRLPYDQATAVASQATVAYNGSNHPGGIGGKMYDYMALGLPIVGYFPLHSQSELFVNKYQVGLVANTLNDLKNNIKMLFYHPEKRKILADNCTDKAKLFDRKVLAKDFNNYLQQFIH